MILNERRLRHCCRKEKVLADAAAKITCFPEAMTEFSVKTNAAKRDFERQAGSVDDLTNGCQLGCRGSVFPFLGYPRQNVIRSYAIPHQRSKIVPHGLSGSPVDILLYFFLRDRLTHPIEK
jgi:hypothetical protein